MSLWTSLGGWLGKRIGLSDGAFWSSYYGGSTYSGRAVGPENALNVSAWWAGVRRTAETVGTLPCQLFKTLSNGGREPQGEHPLYTVVHDLPNDEQTAVEYWEGMTAWLCVQGNAFSEKTINGADQVVGLGRPFHCVNVFRNTNGELRYQFYERGKREELPEEKVFHIRGFGFGGDMGLSPIAYAKQSLAAALDTEEAAARNFANGIRPGGWLKWKGGEMKPDQRQQVYNKMIRPMQGVENTGSIGLLEGDFDFIATTMNAEDAEMLASRRFSVEDVCRWIGIPPILVGHAGEGVTMWGTGVEQIMLSWYILSLRAFLRRIENAIYRSLLTPAERGVIHVEFNVEGLLRGDSKTRAEIQQIQVNSGIRTRNEVRGLENLPKMKGGDLLTVQNQNIALQDLLQPAVAPGQPGEPQQPPQPANNVRPIRPPTRTGT